MAVLVTGGTGFVGAALIDKLLNWETKIFSISRSAPEPRKGVIPLRGNVLEPFFGLKEILCGKTDDISAVYHLAAILRLGKDKDGSIWQTNVEGTKNVIDFCLNARIPHLYFCSSAYTQGRNPYELSKSCCEDMVKTSGIPKITIFKPSIIMSTNDRYFSGHVSLFIKIIINTLSAARVTWRKAEETLRLPVLLEPVLRIKGNPEAKINMIQLDQVIQGMSEITDAGTYWLTNPDPPTIQQVCDWVGDDINVRIKMIKSDFKRMPLEAILEKKIGPFTPYLWGDDFPSDLKKCPSISHELIMSTVRKTVI